MTIVYTRQSTFTNGDIVDASLLNAEYDRLAVVGASVETRLSTTEGSIAALGTAATATVTDSTTDQTIGRLIKQGDTARLLAASTSGPLGVGTSAPHEKLVSLTSDNTTVGLCAYEQTVGGSAKLHLDVRNNAGLPITMGAIRADMTFGGTGVESGDLQFDTIDTGARALRMRISPTGNVGIGTGSSEAKLELAQNFDGQQSLRISHNNRAVGAGHYFSLSGASNEALAQFYDDGTSASVVTLSGYSKHEFHTDGSLRVLIDSFGNVLYGKTSAENTNQGVRILGRSGFVSMSRDSLHTLELNRNSSNGAVQEFSRQGTTVGSISVTGSVTAYNTSSDQRLKENIIDSVSASDDIDAIQIRQYDWIADGEHQKYGVVTQELISIAPYAVHVPENPEEMQAVDYSKLVPMMIKEIQELRARVALLEV
jgi:hypothetical protein